MENKAIVMQTPTGEKFCGYGHLAPMTPGKDMIVFEKAFSLTRDNKLITRIDTKTSINIDIDDVFWDNYEIVEMFVKEWYKKFNKQSLF